MSNIIQYLAEMKIQEAINNGEFKDLLGYGKPIDNSDYFNAPEDERMTFHIMKNAGLVPEELNLRKDIYNLKRYVQKCNDLDKQEKALLKIRDLETRIVFKK